MKQQPSTRGVWYAIMLCAVTAMLIGFSMKTQNDAQQFLEATKEETVPQAVDVSALAEEARNRVRKEMEETQTAVAEANREAEEAVMAASAVASPLPDSTPLSFQSPVSGTVQKEFTGSAPTRSETMDDWRTHTGIDIAAPLGTEVVAAERGTVESVTEDGANGVSLAIDHGQGMKSVYRNLAKMPAVSEGQTVTKGQTIGKVGDTADNESAEPPHLHYELYRDGTSVNPQKEWQ